MSSNSNISGVKIFECTMRGVFCDIFNCRKQAEWFIGKPGGPIGGHMKLCGDHKQELIDSLREGITEVAEVDTSDGNNEDSGNSDTLTSEERPSTPYKCQYCGREGFSNTGSLTMHERFCKAKQ